MKQTTATGKNYTFQKIKIRYLYISAGGRLKTFKNRSR